MSSFKSTMRLAAMAAAIMGISACSADYRNHGYIPSEDQLGEIVVGVDTRDSVAENMGPPSSGGVLSDSGYYYVRSRVRSFAYTAPVIVDRQVLAISFDNRGVVSNVERFGLEDGRVITLERRVTESSVIDRTFLRQLLGSFGRLRPSAL